MQDNLNFIITAKGSDDLIGAFVICKSKKSCDEANVIKLRKTTLPRSFVTDPNFAVILERSEEFRNSGPPLEDDSGRDLLS